MTDIKPADVLFVWGDSFVDHAIERVTRGPSHCALFLTESTLVEAQFNRHVGESPLETYLSPHNRLEVWRDPTLTDDDRAAMIEYAKTLYGTPYDYALIPLEWAHFDFGARLAWYHEHKHVICSTFVDDVAQSRGRHWARVANPAPVDLCDGGALIQIYAWESGRWEQKASA